MALNPKDTAGFSVSDAGHVVATGISGAVRTVAADAALAIAPTDCHILVSSAGGGGALATETMEDGQFCTITMTAFNTGVYTVTVSDGTLTFNAADEAATIYHDGTELRVASLYGATVV